MILLREWLAEIEPAHVGMVLLLCAMVSPFVVAVTL